MDFVYIIPERQTKPARQSPPDGQERCPGSRLMLRIRALRLIKPPRRGIHT